MEWNHQQEHSQPSAGESQAQPPPLSLSEQGNQTATNDERYAYYKAHPKEYLKAAVAPANLSNWILAFIGMAGISVGICTIFAVVRQTNIAVSKERAVLAFSLGEEKIYRTDEEEETWQLDFTIRNLGPTRADFVKFQVFTESRGKDKKVRKIPSYYLHVPEVIDGNGQTADLAIMPDVVSLDDVFEGKIAVHLTGDIVYRDVFGKRRKTKFDWVWRTYKQHGPRLMRDFRWEETGERQNRVT
jgi:hypothetical protein